MKGSLRQIAHALGGEISGSQVLAPGPGHSAKDRSLSVKLSSTAPDGFIVHSFSGDDPIVCRDYVRGRLGLQPFKPNGHAEKIVSFDYRDPATGAVRYRKERIERADGSKTFVIKPKGRNGTEPLLYGGERLADLGEGQPVWIVEGEKKVDRLRALGAIAVSGDAGAKSRWAPSHAELLRGLDVILWPDSDQPGEAYIANAAACIGDGAASIRVVRPFGPPNGTKGRDVCDWKGDSEELALLVGGAEPYVPLGARINDDNQTRLLSYDEMVALPPTDWAIYGVLPKRSKSVLFGQSDSFKSFLVADMGCSASTGRSYHGHAVKRCKVIYVANEGANAVGRKRIPAWMAYHEIPPEDRGNIYLVKTETILPNEISRANLLAAIRTIIAPGEDFLLIIDVLRGTMTGSESDDEAAHAWTRAAEILIEEGAAILVVTHSPYGDDGRMRGSSHLWGSFDTRLHVEGDKERRTAILRVNRHKDHDSGGGWGFQLDEQAIEEHPGETSLVSRLDGEVRTKKGRGKLPDSAKLCLAALNEALDDAGAIPPASNYIPRNVKAVTLKQWKDYFWRRSGLDTVDKNSNLERHSKVDKVDKNSSERKAFDRGKEKLQAEKIIAIWGTYVWKT
jgi:hypothetical protein